MKKLNASGAAQLALTRVELLVLVAVIGLLGGFFLVLPGFGRAHEKAATLQCLNNLRQLGSAIFLYADDHNQCFPAAERQPTNPVFPTNVLPRICDLLSKYTDLTQQPFLCPADKGPAKLPPTYFVREGSSYEWNYTFNGQSIENEALRWRPGDAPLMYDYDNCHKGPAGDSKNVFFADGRADPLMRPHGPKRPPKR